MTVKEWKEDIWRKIKVMNRDPSITNVAKVVGEIERYDDFYDNAMEIFYRRFTVKAYLIKIRLDNMDKITRFELMYGNAK